MRSTTTRATLCCASCSAAHECRPHAAHANLDADATQGGPPLLVHEGGDEAVPHALQDGQPWQVRRACPHARAGVAASTCGVHAMQQQADGAQVSEEEKMWLHMALLTALPLPAEQFVEEALYKVGGPGCARMCGAQATCNADIPAQPYRLTCCPTTTTGLSQTQLRPHCCSHPPPSICHFLAPLGS